MEKWKPPKQATPNPVGKLIKPKPIKQNKRIILKGADS